jgi:hypothetical protein
MPLPLSTVILSSPPVAGFVGLGASRTFAIDLCFLNLGRSVTRRLVIADEESLVFCLCPTALRVLRDLPVRRRNRLVE